MNFIPSYTYVILRILQVTCFLYPVLGISHSVQKDVLDFIRVIFVNKLSKFAISDECRFQCLSLLIGKPIPYVQRSDST